MRLAMKPTTLKIGFFTLTALILFIAQFLPIRPAAAADVIKDRDYTLLSARAAVGGEVVYVLDNRTGLMAIFTWDPGARAFVPSAVVPMSDGLR
jgi:hypothetical protein